jgi:hypothetical protein
VGYDGQVTADWLTVLIEAHFEMFEALEVGIDIEALQHLQLSAGETQSESEFGFVTPRVKYAFVRGPMTTIAAGMGVMLPTSSAETWDHAHPIALDPAFFLAVRPVDLLSLNVSLPVTVLIPVEDAEADPHVFLTPTVGVAAMPLEYIGGFIDIQFHIWAASPPPVDDAGPFRAMNLFLGARSRFLPLMMAEVGAIVPLAGDYAEVADFGLGVRLVATPDVL